MPRLRITLVQSVVTCVILMQSSLLFGSTEVDEEPDEEDDDKKARIYTNPEERRESGMGTMLTHWLKFSGLLELEKEYVESHYEGSGDSTDSEHPSQSLQLGFTIETEDWFEAEFIFEAENDKTFRTRLDEGMVGVDLDDAGFKAGKLYVPFGEYYSHFVMGPALEFGETRATSIIGDYSPSDNIEIAAFVFDSSIDPASNAREFDWGYSFNLLSDDESMRFGISYISDINESEEPLVDDPGTEYVQRVPAYSAYALAGYEHYEITMEMVHVNDEITELDPGINQPESYNIELAYFPSDTLLYALRIEHNRGLEDAPEWSYGVTGSVVLFGRVILSADYLYGRYKDNFVFNNDDLELEFDHTVAVRASLEF